MELLTKEIALHVMGNARADNYLEVILSTAQRFPDVSPATIEEIVKEMYNLKGWRNDKYKSKPARILNMTRKRDQWQKYIDRHFGGSYDHRRSDRDSKDSE